MHDEIVPLNPCDYSVENGRVILEAPAGSGFMRKPGMVVRDNAAFCCVQRSGDFTFSAQVTTLGESPQDGAFLMARQDATCWLKLGMTKEANGRFRIISRRTEGWSVDKLSPELPDGNCFLRIVRRGDAFTLSYGLDAGGWKMLDSYQIQMDERVAVGFGAQSPEGEGCRATVSDITLADVAMLSFLEQD